MFLSAMCYMIYQTISILSIIASRVSTEIMRSLENVRYYRNFGFETVHWNFPFPLKILNGFPERWKLTSWIHRKTAVCAISTQRLRYQNLLTEWTKNSKRTMISAAIGPIESVWKSLPRTLLCWDDTAACVDLRSGSRALASPCYRSPGVVGLAKKWVSEMCMIIPILRQGHGGDCIRCSRRDRSICQHSLQLIKYH